MRIERAYRMAEGEKKRREAKLRAGVDQNKVLLEFWRTTVKQMSYRVKRMPQPNIFDRRMPDICPTCGKEVMDWQNYCDHCGQALLWE